MIVCFIIPATSQIPYFAPTVGNNKLYGYTSLKLRPGKNAQETYSTFQYGIGNYSAVGLDIYTSNSDSYMGYLVRGGMTINPYFNIGCQFTPTFNLSNNMRFEYLTSALYMNGNIIENGKLFWVSNTWYGINKGVKDSFSQYLYLGSSFNLPKSQVITPMIGTIYSWYFDEKADLTFGAYWTIQKFNIYLWTNDILTKNPRIILGVDFVL